MFILLYILCGAVAGISAGLFGLGGGVIMVPVLYFILKTQGVDEAICIQIAIATSLATVVITSLLATFRHQRAGFVAWDRVAKLVPGILVGSFIGGLALGYLPTNLLRYFFAAFEIVIAAELLSNKLASLSNHSFGIGAHLIAGLVIGCLSAILGIGGGTMHVPFLIVTGLSMRQAVASSSACGVFIALAGTAAILASQQAALATHLDYVTGYIYWPAVGLLLLGSIPMVQVGVILVHRLPVKTLRLGFAGYLVCAALLLVWR